MTEQYNNPTPIPQDEEEIDIVWLIRYVWSKRKIIIYTTVPMFLICMVVFLCKPKQYNSTASILPISGGSSISGGMSMLASMAGVNLKKPSQNVITPDLYPAVARTTPFMRKLMSVPLKWKDNDTIMSTYEYAERLKPSVLDYIKAYTIGLPATIANAINPPINPAIDAALAAEDKELNYLVLSSTERKAIGLLSKMVSVEEDAKIDAINVSATCEVPEQAAVLASSALDILQEIITEYKTKSSSQTLGFLEERYESTRQDYEKVREQFFSYKDSHRNMIDERVDVRYQELSDQYQISYQILKNLAGQIEEAKLEVMEETPVFSVLQPAVMPSDKSGPKFMIHAIAGIMLGLIFSIGWFIVQIGYFQVFDEKKYKAIKAQYETKEEEAA